MGKIYDMSIIENIHVTNIMMVDLWPSSYALRLEFIEIAFLVKA